LLYGTTAVFLELLGLASLEDLPRIEELSVALRSPLERGGDVTE
jgi:chromosome segregation and condensation protein ScpB